MSLWAEYIAELRGPEYRQWLEFPDCFAAYSLPEDKECIIIHDMYVKSWARKSGRGKLLLDDVCEIGRKAGKKFVVAEIELNTLTVDQALGAQLAVGFKPVAAYTGIICMRKEL